MIKYQYTIFGKIKSVYEEQQSAFTTMANDSHHSTLDPALMTHLTSTLECPNTCTFADVMAAIRDSVSVLKFWAKIIYCMLSMR